MRYIEHKRPDIGDILLCKSFTMLGRAIGNSFRSPSPLRWASGPRPSNHNGIIGYDNTLQMCVFEALGKGFVATPIYHYFTDVDRNVCEIKIVRYGLSGSEMLASNHWLQAHVGTPYDYRAYVSLTWRIALRLMPVRLIQDNARFYCSEAVSEMFSHLQHRFLPELCTPFAVEKLVADGYFTIIAECS